MNDRQFLIWIHERLIKHGDDPLFDYMHKLRAIINSTDEKQYTANNLTINSIEELVK